MFAAQAPNKQYAPEWKIAKIFMAEHWEDTFKTFGVRVGKFGANDDLELVCWQNDCENKWNST